MSDELITQDLLMLVTHDLRAPITAIQGYVELIENVGELNPLQVRYCNRVLASLDRMDTLISTVLDMVMVAEGNLNTVDCDLGAIIHSAVDLVDDVAEQAAVTIEVELADDLDVIQGDSHLLEHVVSNLLTNAIKYNREGGQILVTVTSQPEFMRVDVKDNGVGIPLRDQESVFDKGYRGGNSAKAGAAGSGLGLALVRAIVQKHQGYIWFESVEGEGSTFSFTLPRKVQRNGGVNSLDEHPANHSESFESIRHTDDEQSIEDVDGIDDNMQEARDSTEIDSSNDVV